MEFQGEKSTQFPPTLPKNGVFNIRSITADVLGTLLELWNAFEMNFSAYFTIYIFSSISRKL